ncbi:MAG: transporter substrate-binding domain-containing protein, partial [Gammaproteobacteria bacterium]|nr:transporter substrate-binding domain-containing protein [Gammaproteobacteria bacterium]
MVTRNYNFLLLLSFIFFLASCSNGPDRLEEIKKKGELVIITRNAATTYYESSDVYLGVEYELARAFADYIGVKARFIIKDDITTLFSSLTSGEGDLVAAGLTQTDEREKHFLFGPEYQKVTQQLVCRRGGKQPRKTADLKDINLKVSVDSSYVETLNKVKQQHPDVNWEEVP